MKVIIAGSRSVTRYAALDAAILRAYNDKGITITEIVSGGAQGADRLGEMRARDFAIPLKVFRADWKRYGMRAGMLRNQQMAEYADALIALWDGDSRGTEHMIKCMEKCGKPVYVYLAK